MNELRKKLLKQLARNTFMIKQGLDADEELKAIRGLRLNAILDITLKELPERLKVTLEQDEYDSGYSIGWNSAIIRMHQILTAAKEAK